ncbi:FK506-binding protein [Posidoniimonas polymericola]|uniref:Peptidyl-prolyl cis-trans isomerase n=1 Tax=Posidoniimonas polymericola TaxID=2528002 RepID=A0A5C5ZD63_9BACT|nr:FKBP-type peptidyl-prolyl cis-trans isomerase [Posidoniimonas polymericola]TWT85349.1 FK506-binding protein [Posidoniimonas polymericola]
MKPPISLRITDNQIGSGRVCVPGDVAVCHWVCRRRKGDILFASDADSPHPIRVGARDYCVGVEYGLLGMRVGGRRTIVVPPNLTYVEQKIYPELPANGLLIYQLELIDLPKKWDPDMEQRLSPPPPSG